MFNRIIKLAALALFLGAAGFNAYAYDDGDFQIWHTEAQDIGIGKGTKFTMEEEWRFGDDARELFYQHYEWGVVYGFDRRLDLGFNYRQVYDKYKHKFREENRPHVNAIAKLDIWKFRFEDRNRLEYRHFRYKEDSVRYRNKFTLKYPFDFRTIKAAPYLSDEIFVSSDGTGFNRNRFYSGLETGLTKYVKTDIFYLLQSSRVSGSKWRAANVLGMKLKIIF